MISFLFFKKSFLILCVLIVFTISAVDVFGHGPTGIDRSPPIDFESRNVTVESKMYPSDMTVGDFSNA